MQWQGDIKTGVTDALGIQSGFYQDIELLETRSVFTLPARPLEMISLVFASWEVPGHSGRGSGVFITF